MRARPPKTSVEAGSIVVRTALERADGTDLPPLEVRLPVAQADLLDPTATPGIGALAALAAAIGEDLHVDGPVDSLMRAGAPRIMATLADWWGRPAQTVHADDVYETPAGGDGVGLFFTRGVDSWSTLLDLIEAEPGERVTHLVTVQHAIGPLAPVQAEVIAGHGPIADELGLELITIETSAQSLLHDHAPWIDACAAALTGAGLQAGAALRRLVLTSDHPAGVHPRTGVDTDLIGPLRTGRTEVIAGNVQRSRAERVAHLIGSSLARTTLQVCWEGLTVRNCGRCVKCVLTMADLAIAGDPDPAAGFDAPLDPDHIRRMDLKPVMTPFMPEIIEGLPAEHEELRRAWSDAWDRANGVEPRRRWGDEAPAALAGPSLPTRVASALRETTGQPVAPAPAPLGWRRGSVPLRPSLDLHDEIRALVAEAPSRPLAWAVVEPLVRDGARDARQAGLSAALQSAHGAGLCYIPGVLWAHSDPPVLGPDVVTRLLRSVRVRAWWRGDGDLEPLRVLEAIENGCLPLQVMPDGTARRLVRDLPPALAPIVVREEAIEDLDLSPDAVDDVLRPVADHVLTGSMEHDLLSGAYP